MDHPLRPTALEIASGRMYGEYRDSAGLGPGDDRRLTPLAALEEAVLPALRRPPCFVSFSGGRDSSTVLAAATRAARREGLPPPVPVTLRVRDAPLAEESEWQERVIRHLALRDWELRDAGNDMDRLGPFSVSVLRRHGVLYPPNTFLQIPMLEAARGHPLLSGFGGDELFATWRWRRQAEVLGWRRPPTPRAALSLVFAASPARLRRAREARRRQLWELAWLRPEAARMAGALDAAGRVEQPRSWSRWLDWFVRQRSVCAPRWSLALLAADAGAELAHPFLDAGFLDALARTGGHRGFGDRTAAMRSIFAGVLPDALLRRSTKARYGETFWGPRTRDFAERWSGGGVDSELVDPVALRKEWLKPNPHEDSAMLLHAAWLSEDS